MTVIRAPSSQPNFHATLRKELDKESIEHILRHALEVSLSQEVAKINDFFLLHTQGNEINTYYVEAETSREGINMQKIFTTEKGCLTIQFFLNTDTRVRVQFFKHTRNLHGELEVNPTYPMKTFI